MVEPGRVASSGIVQLVARVRNSAEEFNGGRTRGTGRGECGSKKLIANSFNTSSMLIPFGCGVDPGPVGISSGGDVKGNAVVDR